MPEIFPSLVMSSQKAPQPCLVENRGIAVCAVDERLEARARAGMLEQHVRFVSLGRACGMRASLRSCGRRAFFYKRWARLAT